MIYSIHRTYRVEDVIYVEASSAKEAKAKALDGDYIDQTDSAACGPTRYGRARRRPDVRVSDLGVVTTGNDEQQ